MNREGDNKGCSVGESKFKRIQEERKERKERSEEQ